MYPRFPLPDGHAYACTSHPLHHSGRDALDGLKLASAQRRLRTSWSARDVNPDGNYSGQTQDAVCGVQAAYGIPVTGWLDRETWDALWCGPPGVSSDHAADTA